MPESTHVETLPQRVVRLLGPYQPLYKAARWAYRAGNRCLQPLRTAREAALIRGFHKLYYHGRWGKEALWRGFHWFGVPCQKCPLDLCIYQEILFRTRPDVIVECGVCFGGSTLYLAHLCDLLGTGRIIACDITLANVYDQVRRHPRIELLEGSSTAPEIAQTIRERCAGQRTMVILDSDHTAAHASEELRLYAPLVSPGCYLICEDTNINGHPVLESFGPGPYEAVRAFTAQASGWTVDRNCERLLLTFNPGGYLRRDPPNEGDARPDPSS